MPIGLRSLVAGLAIAATVSAPRPSEATVVRALDLSQKTQVARAIVLAKVEKQEARWMIVGGSIKTVVTMRVEQALKGDVAVGKTIHVVMPGGQIEDFVHRVSGTSTFAKGERAVMFLEPHADGWVEIGIGIGKYGVKKGMVTHAPDVTEARSQSDGMKLKPAEPMKPRALDGFLDEIRSLLAAEAK